ncbi:MAG: hypothetical protein M3Z24_15835, partial [Chloroflexota bacterium]|nr:hypothetical protein [Chloroflexota bacterium]
MKKSPQISQVAFHNRPNARQGVQLLDKQGIEFIRILYYNIMYIGWRIALMNADLNYEATHQGKMMSINRDSQV